VGSTLAEFDPANILAKNPAKKPATEVVKESEGKGTVAPNGNLARAEGGQRALEAHV